MQEYASSGGSSSEHPREEKEMKKHRKKNNTAVRMTAAAMAVTLAAGPASTVAYALPADTSNTAVTLDAQQSQTKTQQLYTVGNTSYENGAVPRRVTGMTVSILVFGFQRAQHSKFVRQIPRLVRI